MKHAFCLLLPTLGLALSAQAQSARPQSRQPLLAQQLELVPVAAAPVPAYHLAGRVYGPTGRPLPGATISVKGTDTVVSTDAAGRFWLELPTQAASTLVAAYAGYEDQRLSVLPNVPLLNVTLRPVPLTDASVAHALKAGDLAPDFILPTTAGTTFRLREHRGHPVVLYFYPKDGSPGCTQEACSFRDQYEDFQRLGAEVVGISSDDAASHQRFADRHELPFTLLSDADGQLRRKYAVPRAALGLLPGRVTYVLDGEGRVRYVFSSLRDATGHVANAKEMLRGLQ